MDRPLVSFLIPTRNQTVMLRDSIGSIGRLASGRHDYEILLAVDSDDVDTLAIIPERKCSNQGRAGLPALDFRFRSRNTRDFQSQIQDQKHVFTPK